MLAIARIGGLAGFCIVLLGTHGASAADLEFNRDVRPILSANCFACHGFDAKARKADLRLDVPEGAFAERDGATAIKPGDLARSAVWERITSTDPDLVMPPPSSRKALTAAQKETLKRWIEQGAPYQKHWAFERPVAAAEPAVQNAAWARTPVDRFLLAKMEAAGLAPRPAADRPTLIRRVAFTLTGLPPTLAEVDAYLADTADGAYERMVDRYLQSPRYGEEMARHWLDVARYADTHGLHLDNEREMWAYRDWVVQAFNRNLPFDQFTIEQLAGDQLPNPTKDQLIATGFNRCNVTTSEGGSIEAEFLYRYAVDRTSTTIQTWLGLTGGCAVCHDHKYDPLTMQEFYSLYAFFYSAADPAMDRNIRNTDPFLSLATKEQEAEMAARKTAEKTARDNLQALVSRLEYADVMADAQNPPPAEPVVDVWLDDAFPDGVKVTSTSRNAPTWSTTLDGTPPPSGLRALHQAGGAMYQDRFDCGVQPFIIPEQGRLSVWVRPDPFEPPKALMIELVSTKGTRRALWGDAEKLGSGEIGKPERLRVGDLPAPGQWTQLTVTADALQLAAGDVVRTVALVEFGGIVDWDALQAAGTLRPQDDPRVSLRKWWQFRAGQDAPGVPDDVKAALKDGPDKEIAPELREKVRHYFLAEIARPNTGEWRQARQAVAQAAAARMAYEESIPGTFIFKDVPQPRDAFVMLRGQYDKPGEKVAPNVPAILPPLTVAPPDRRPQRLDLAQWLVAPEQPLTARVTVNRFWQQVFGTGLVKTSYDFGSQGELPSHPELLDWLAIWYREHGWNTKELMRLLVTSAAFQQDTRVTPELLARDPENRLYARGPRFRLDAEQIRDNALFVSGLINLQMGGPGVKPYQPPNIWEPVGYSDSNTRFYLQDHGAALYRRSLYCYLKRTAPPPFMSNFDGPNREQFCTKRERSNTPLQALQLMNDVQHFEAARGLAQRMISEGGPTPESRLAFAYRTILSRAPDSAELTVVRQALSDFLERYRNDPEAAAKVVRVGEASSQQLAPPLELAAYTLIANLLLNLDETVTRN